MPTLQHIPRVSLAQLPTALEAMPRLGEAAGLPNLWFKRDDNTGLALGGNKARKLEFLMADARRQGADVVFTTGGKQSNHARMTAAAARRLGMDSVLFLADPEPPERQGNLLLDRMFGAEVRFIPGLTLQQMYDRMEEHAATLRAEGRHPYIIPVGGSTHLGCLGYVRAVEELAAQARERDLRVDVMVVAAGSTGTLSGMLLGQRQFLSEARVYGISVSPPAPVGQLKCARIIGEAAELLDVDWRPKPEEIPIRDEWLGPGYGVPTEEGMEAIRLAARCEGCLLDPVYTGKAFAGAMGLARLGEIRPEENVVFWHTGGAPALFAYDHLFNDW
jgi:D-cysteine desulfhydrase family pyridoxal phosphate-dependent enzyme